MTQSSTSRRAFLGGATAATTGLAASPVTSARAQETVQLTMVSARPKPW